jgi:TPR repeat protein
MEQASVDEAAFGAYLKAAELGDHVCMLKVAKYLADGTGVERNTGAAVSWYKRAGVKEPLFRLFSNLNRETAAVEQFQKKLCNRGRTDLLGLLQSILDPKNGLVFAAKYFYELYKTVRVGGELTMPVWYNLEERRADDFVGYRGEREVLELLCFHVEVSEIRISTSLRGRDLIRRYHAMAHSKVTLVVVAQNECPTLETIVRGLGDLVVVRSNKPLTRLEKLLRYLASEGHQWVAQVWVEQAKPECPEKDCVLAELWALLNNTAASVVAFTAAAEGNHAVANFSLALYYEPTDRALAEKYLAQAAKLGFTKAWQKLGELHEENGDMIKALSCYSCCTDEGAKLYHQSRFVPDPESLALLTKAAATGHKLAVYHLAGIHFRAQRYKKAYTLYIKVALLYSDAAVKVGVILRKGVGVSRDTRRAEAYFKFAVGADTTEAYYQLGLLRAAGNQASLAPLEKSEYLFTRAADRGHPGAKFQLAQSSMPGRKRKLLLEVMDLGPSAPAATAAFQVAQSYRGIDEKQAFLYLIKTLQLCKGRHGGALVEIGKYYARTGEYGQAKDFYLRSLLQNETDEVRHLLAGCYREGLGVTKDEAAASYWDPKRQVDPTWGAIVVEMGAVVDAADPCLKELCGRLLPGKFTGEDEPQRVFPRCAVVALVLGGNNGRWETGSAETTTRQVLAPLTAAGIPAIVCTNCRKKDTRLSFQRCAKCKEVFYCSKKCQREHWRRPEAPHRETCVLKPLITQRYLDAKGVFLWQLLMQHEEVATEKIAAMELFRQELALTPQFDLNRCVCCCCFSFLFLILPPSPSGSCALTSRL